MPAFANAWRGTKFEDVEGSIGPEALNDIKANAAQRLVRLFR
jgi:hypothetical protein